MKFCLVLIAFVFCLRAAAAEEFTIRFARAYKVGQKHEFSMTNSEIKYMQLQVGGEIKLPPPGANGNATANFDGETEILEVTEDGERSQIRITVKKLVAKTAGSEQKVVLAPGTQILASFANLVVNFSVDGKPVSDGTAAILSRFFGAHSKDAKDDDMLGTKEKQSVGDKWEINKAHAAKSIGLQPGDLEGSMTLVGVVNKGGVRCLDILGEVTLKKIPGPGHKGFIVTKSGGEMKFRWLLPVDHSLQPLSKTLTQNFSIDSEGSRNAQKVEVSESERNTRTRTSKQVE